MSKALTAEQSSELVIHMKPALEMSDDQFYEFCRLNSELRIERTAEGDIIVMPPTGGETGRKNAKLLALFVNWDGVDNSGVSFDSSTGFILPNGATRAPDVAWVMKSRLATLTREQKQKFIPLCPDFVLELRSPSDSLASVKEKMEEYIANGAQLGWLLDPMNRSVSVYHSDGRIDVLDDPETISGDPVLPGLIVVNIRRIWEPDF